MTLAIKVLIIVNAMFGFISYGVEQCAIYNFSYHNIQYKPFLSQYNIKNLKFKKGVGIAIKSKETSSKLAI